MTREYGDRHFREPNLAPTDAKLQHYVPRRYVNRFATANQISVYEPDTGVTYSTSVGNVAAETYFNDLRYEQEKLSTETWFANVIEAPFWPLLDRLCADPDTIGTLSEPEETILCRYVAAQRLRVPHRRQYLERTRSQFREWAAGMISTALKKAVPVEEVDDYLTDSGKLHWLRPQRTYQPGEAMSAELGEIAGDANILIAKPWRIGCVDSRAALCTSDNPVSTHLPSVLPNWWIGFEDAEQFFALSPTLLLHFLPLPRGHDRPSCGARRRLDFSRWEASRARSIIVYESTRCVFGRPPFMHRDLARRNVFAFDDTTRDFAIEFSGYDPAKIEPMGQGWIKLIPPGIPHVPSI